MQSSMVEFHSIQLYPVVNSIWGYRNPYDNEDPIPFIIKAIDHEHGMRVKLIDEGIWMWIDYHPETWNTFFVLIHRIKKEPYYHLK